ncbi:aminotransferase class IV [Desulforhopalus singaporensis]|uniref:branched-chain-amino-acid transaminase n=1 Tax=Desulforhopalus singaporensis TaxID=91360 RepID=A0A1H0LXZ4_9BACT|nr:aminotransferase class IV [Desulforhopalus singaporensis]SDO73068.1 branched-chain amino acid aminotransferase [Desulforhopalus singaporensis]
MDIFFINNKFVSKEDAVISVNDLSLLRGYGVFDFLRTYNGCPFYLKEHLKRFATSARLIGLFLPLPEDRIGDFVREAIDRSDHPEKNVRLLLTGGVSDNGITPGDNPQLIILVTAVETPPGHWLDKGVKVITSHVERFMPPAKTINYIPAIISLNSAARQGAIEAIYVDKDGYMLEGTTSNFFAFKNNTLITPPGDRILAGITRNVVLELAKSRFELVERRVHKDEIALFDESFITSSTKEVVPVTTIDEVTLGDSPGPRTTRVLSLFHEFTSSYGK